MRYAAHLFWVALSEPSGARCWLSYPPARPMMSLHFLLFSKVLHLAMRAKKVKNQGKELGQIMDQG